MKVRDLSIYVNKMLVHQQIILETHGVVAFNFLHNLKSGDVVEANGAVFTVPVNGIYSITVASSTDNASIQAHKIDGPGVPKAMIGGKLVNVAVIEKLKEGKCGKILYADIS